MKNINEASLSRVWQHVESGRPVALITAFRSENDRQTNIRLNKQLAATIRDLGYGYFFVDGYWIENKDTPEEVHVAEDSLFVIGPDPAFRDPTKSNDMQDEVFIDAMTSLAGKYKQEGVLIKHSKGVAVYDSNGNEIVKLNQLKPGAMATVYTKLRNNKKSNTFVFESERNDLGWLQRLAGIKIKD